MKNTEFYIRIWIPKQCLLNGKVGVTHHFSAGPGYWHGAGFFSEREFSTARFEFGKSTEIKGIYSNTPVPMLRMVSGKDIWGNTCLHQHSAGAGCQQKAWGRDCHYATGKEMNTSFRNKELTVKGTLLYSQERFYYR